MGLPSTNYLWEVLSKVVESFYFLIKRLLCPRLGSTRFCGNIVAPPLRENGIRVSSSVHFCILVGEFLSSGLFTKTHSKIIAAPPLAQTGKANTWKILLKQYLFAISKNAPEHKYLEKRHFPLTKVFSKRKYQSI